MGSLIEYNTIIDIKKDIKQENNSLLIKAKEINQRIDKCFSENKNTYEIEYLIKKLKEISKMLNSNIERIENIDKVLLQRNKTDNKKSIHIKGANVLRLKQTITNRLREDKKEEKVGYSI